VDLSVLRRIVEELDDRLSGRRIEQVFALPRHHLSVVVGGRSAPRLWFSAEPDEPHLCLYRGTATAPSRPPAFAMAARRLCRGRRVRSLRMLGGDRVVELCPDASEGRLVFELVPRRASAFVVDELGAVVAVWCPRRGRPSVGEPYVPPARPRRSRADEVDRETWRRIAATGDSRRTVREILRTVDGLGRLAAREVAARHAAGVPIDVAAIEETRRSATAPSSPCVYTPGAFESLRSLPPADELVLAPYPLTHVSDRLRRLDYSSVIDAAADYYSVRARLRRTEAVRDGIAAAIRGARARVARSRGRARDDATAGADPTQLRRAADLLLATPDAVPRGDTVEVPDVYADGARVRITIDPRTDLVGNAQRYYARARRAERGAKRQRARLAELDGRDRLLHDLARRLESCRTSEGHEALLRVAHEAGLAVKVRGGSDPEAEAASSDAPPGDPAESATPAPSARPHGRRGGPSDRDGDAPGRGWQARGDGWYRSVGRGIVAYRTPTGSEILVGRNAAANDRLTHRLARPDDWWLHARGPGAHVVLRSSGGEDAPRPEALAEAASIAAWFSDARSATKVNVDWTRARNVRRPRRRPPGTALLRSHRSVMAIPRSPDEILNHRG
jgi:predicted ribosome quality control (RQC) complex YloA/Tae2 family protein